MSYLKKISFENYRVFDKKYEFEFAPITLVTGPNNSGKSSLTKMLEYLSFASKENNLFRLPKNNPFFISWESIITKNSNYNSINVGIGNFEFNGKKLDLEIHLNQNRITKLIISFDDIIVFCIEHIDSEQNMLEEINIGFFLEILEAAAIETKENKNSIDFLNSLITKGQKKNNINIEKKMSYNDFFYEKINKIKEFKKISSNEIDLENIIDPSVIIKDAKIPKIIKKNFENLGDYREVLDYLDEYLIYSIFYELFQDKYQLIDKEKLNYILLKEGISNIDEYQKIFLPFNTNFINLLNHFSIESKKMIESILNKFPKIIKLRTDYYFKDKIVPKTKLVGFENLYQRYQYPYSHIKKFVNTQIKRLGIGDSLEIREVENVAYIFELIKDNQRYSFQDLGTGYSQIVSIILSIAEIIASSFIDDNGAIYNIEKVVLIEEPEIGLHPNLQAKLADVLAEAISNYSVQFIVETHSEYLIRKLQYLVAKKELKSKEVVIYYFNGEKERKKEDQTCKRIEINKQGILTEKFGEGFFDEATNWQLELIKLNTIQAN